jgi:S1-C subfamily serine protease
MTDRDRASAANPLGVLATSTVAGAAPPPSPPPPPHSVATPIAAAAPIAAAPTAAAPTAVPQPNAPPPPKAAIPAPNPRPVRRSSSDASGPQLPHGQSPEDFDSRATQQAQRAPMLSSVPPTAATIPPPSPLPKRRNTGAPGEAARSPKRLALMAAASLFGVMLLVLGGLGIRAAASAGDGPDAVVRIVTPQGRGTGFFVKGPDDQAYVATAFHVVDGGDQILVERSMPGEGDRAFTEAYPEVEVVAFDAAADLAILRLANVSASRFPRLELADEVEVDGEVKAYGFPSSALTSRAGMVAKDGKLLSAVKFPEYDRRLRRVVRENAVEGLLVSVDVEPGFSGGPTVNDDGEVVGVTVIKDRLHRGQNGAVHVDRLRSLIAEIEPKPTEPTPEQVAELLERVQNEYLLLATAERTEEREHSWIAASELPRLRHLIGTFRRHERDTSVSAGAKLSGRAALGMWAAQMPGQPLATYRSKAVQEALVGCEHAGAPMQGLFGEAVEERKGERQPMAACDELALRPLAWDLLAATMQWNGQSRSYEVTKLERSDSERPLYQAKVRVSGLDELLPIWVGVDYGELRIKLFDNEGELYGVHQAGDTDASDLIGDWRLVVARAPSHALDNTEHSRVERVSIAVDGSRVTVKHVVNESLFAADGARFRCNAGREVQTGLAQRFSGELSDGVVVATPFEKALKQGRDGKRCSWGYRPDAMVTFKRIGDKLAMFRTDGTAYPQMVELERFKSADGDTWN